ncbi:LicD family protein [Bacteroides acidifaciens]|jgi:lipopolysaccharide cholinephosphotransferase|uniref:LicD family protein n=1 Tax=Bacteroides acidifaciens TaxID=85831 RepID=UPI0025B5AD71|nr:LicD family protein [Bacteroides acidifaciens]
MMKKISMDQSRLIILDIMTAIDRVCRELNISYYMAGGTLIGAIRHKGFVPWDDDIDIFVYRKDFDVLIDYLKRNPPFPWFEIYDENRSDYYYPFAKAVDNRTIVEQKNIKTVGGIWVDIFPMENLPENQIERNLFLRRCRILRNIQLAKLSSVSFSGKKAIAKAMIKWLTFPITNKMWLKICKRYMMKYNKQYTGFVGITYSPYAREWFEDYMIRPTIDLPFEDRIFMAPKEYDIILRRTFGDYMILPPKEKQKCHDISAWWKE